MEREKGFPQLFWATNKFKTHNEVTIVFQANSGPNSNGCQVSVCTCNFQKQ